MRESSAVALQARLSRAIARRQRLARWGKTLVMPTLVGSLFAFHWNPWLAIVGFGLFLLEVWFVLLGEAQRCPRCEAQLVRRRGWQEEFAATCPECGCPID
jgi:hypothetical protein